MAQLARLGAAVAETVITEFAETLATSAAVVTGIAALPAPMGPAPMGPAATDAAVGRVPDNGSGISQDGVVSRVAVAGAGWTVTVVDAARVAAMADLVGGTQAVAAPDAAGTTAADELIGEVSAATAGAEG
ncbi:hypothetical protein [Actinoplanes philippinensis]|uniref:hypothetical protein n=1 Tax=Actinoplanes philippinensis TaxID=35752 RepID=UPI0034058B80